MVYLEQVVYGIPAEGGIVGVAGVVGSGRR